MRRTVKEWITSFQEISPLKRYLLLGSITFSFMVIIVSLKFVLRPGNGPDLLKDMGLFAIGTLAATVAIWASREGRK